MWWIDRLGFWLQISEFVILPHNRGFSKQSGLANLSNLAQMNNVHNQEERNTKCLLKWNEIKKVIQKPRRIREIGLIRQFSSKLRQIRQFRRGNFISKNFDLKIKSHKQLSVQRTNTGLTFQAAKLLQTSFQLLISGPCCSKSRIISCFPLEFSLTLDLHIIISET